MLKQTPLYQLHLELTAKMVEFAGYLMPIQYSKGIIHEHKHCRQHAGFFDISHMGQCLISGDTAIHELEKLTPSTLSNLTVGQQKYTVLTNQNGGIIDDIIVTRTDSGLMLIVNAACKDKDFAHLKAHLSAHCEFTELPEQALIALQGAAAIGIMEKLSPKAAQLRFMHACTTDINGIPCHISRSGYTGEDGFEISVANHHAEQLARLLLAENDVEAIGLGARDTLRLEAGLCLYGHELNETITPVEAGLQWLIRKDGGDFLGADKIKQNAEKTRVGLLIDSKIPVRDGSIITDSADNIVGHVTSGGFSPSLGKPIAMALLNRDCANLGNSLYATVREQIVPLLVTKLPFIPHRYQR
ncbi:MAG: glycine cleavage system aminomethyltransferase GcvT [Methylococcales bacterium]|jgi:aminomethyltransferase|nr:glycine cleavage system aminomethyltransferase GcvT [Methylococcales bacterium]